MHRDFRTNDGDSRRKPKHMSVQVGERFLAQRQWKQQSCFQISNEDNDGVETNLLNILTLTFILIIGF